jgi:hypothetical protein
VEVVALVEIVDEPGMGRLPSQELAGQRARGRAVDRDERPQPTEVLACRLPYLWRTSLTYYVLPHTLTLKLRAQAVEPRLAACPLE